MTLEQRQLGRTAVYVSPLCLSTMMFGPWGDKDRAASVHIIHRAGLGGRQGAERLECPTQ